MKNKIIINGPCVPKERPRHTRTGMIYTPKATKDYEALVALTCERLVKQPYDEPLKVEIHVYKKPPTSWSKKRREFAVKNNTCVVVKPDVDNYAKSVLDGLNGVLFTDDKLVADLRVVKRYAEEDYTVIEWERLENEHE